MRIETCALLLALAAGGCVQKMGTEGHRRVYAPATSGGSDSLVRALPDGTIARGRLPRDTAYEQGLTYSGGRGSPVAEIPVPVNAALLKRGRQRYEIYCAPCHGFGGDGNGMIVQRGFLAPPSYHIDRLRKAPAGHFFDVITHGYNAMYGYSDRVPVADRWAIVAYIRALQLSQNASFSNLTAEERARLPEATR